jgi:hypothetical protein
MIQLELWVEKFVLVRMRRMVQWLERVLEWAYQSGKLHWLAVGLPVPLDFGV